MVNNFIGQNGPDDRIFYDMLISRLDSVWQSRIRQIQGNSTKEELWREMDKHMLALHPMHNRRILFFNLKPKKDKLHSTFLARIVDEAAIAEMEKISTHV